MAEKGFDMAYDRGRQKRGGRGGLSRPTFSANFFLVRA